MKTMIRKWLAGALAVALLLAPAAPVPVADAQVNTSPQYFWFQVIDERGEPYTGQNVQCSIFRPNQHASIVLHTSATLSNNVASRDPLFSDASGRVHFYSTSQDPVDIACYYVHGGSAFINRLDRFTHKVVVPRQQTYKVSRFSVNNATTATNQSAGISIPSGALVRDVIVQNLNPKGVASAYHISVGFAGNHAIAANVNALVDALALTSPDEWLRAHVQLANAGTVNERVGTSHRGTALQRLIAGHGSASGSIGFYSEIPYLVHVASGLDVTYAVTVPATATARLHVYILWQQLHVGINRLGLTN